MMTMLEPIPVGLRCHVEPTTTRKLPDWITWRRRAVRRRPSRLAVIDVETATRETLALPGFDVKRWPPEAQALLFGRLHLYELQAGEWRKVAEYVFYPDDLPRGAIEELTRIHHAMTVEGADGRELKDGTRCELLPLSAFLTIFYRECVERACLIVGFNLVFDLSRLATKATRAKKGRFRDGFSFVLWPKPDAEKRGEYRPRLLAKVDTNGHADLAFGTVSLPPTPRHPKRSTWTSQSELLELRRLAYALSGEFFGLESSLRAFGVDDQKAPVATHGVISPEYVAYNRHDVDVTAKLAFALLAEFDRHPFSREAGGDVSETALRSPASLAKRYLDYLGVKPRLEIQPEFPRAILGVGMEAFHGGRAETRIRGDAPVTCTDLTSEYPTVAVLLGLWRFTTARTIRVDDATEETRQFLQSVTRADLLKPSTWSHLNVFCFVDPDDDWLPVRGQFGDDSTTWTSAVTRQGNWPRPVWFALPDVCASRLITGKAPRILRAFRLVAEGIQDELQPVAFRGMVHFDPRTQDFFKLLVEERVRIKVSNELSKSEAQALEWGLKLCANSAAFGMLTEVNRQKPAYREVPEVSVWTGADCNLTDSPDFTTPVLIREQGGRWYCPPLAALVCAGGRLIIALLQALVEERGGTFAFSDTDSMAIVSQQSRGRLPTNGNDLNVLSWDDVDEIQAILNQLNPYDRRLIPNLLKIENVNFADDGVTRRELWSHTVSPKRYALFIRDQSGNRELVEGTESALGGYLDPADDWHERWWEARIKGAACPFANLPAVKSFTIGNWDTYHRFERLNRGKTYASQIKPFNFAMTVRECGWSIGGNRTLLAGYEPETASRDLDREPLSWIDVQTGETRSIGVDPRPTIYPRPANHPRHAWVVGWANVWQNYWGHRVATARGGDAPMGTLPTVLTPRVIRPSRIIYIGKELVEIASTEVDLPTDGIVTYGHDEKAEWKALRAGRLFGDVLEKMEHDRTINRDLKHDWLNGTFPEPKGQFSWLLTAEQFARKAIEAFGIEPPDNRWLVFGVYDCEREAGLAGIMDRIRGMVAREGQSKTAQILGIPRSTLQDYLRSEQTATGELQIPAHAIVQMGRILNGDDPAPRRERASTSIKRR